MCSLMSQAAGGVDRVVRVGAGRTGEEKGMTTEERDAAEKRRRAIVLIPGFRREERFFRRDVLVRNLTVAETVPLERGERIEVAGDPGQRLNAKGLRGRPRGPDLDVFEAYWADMAQEDAELGPWRKFGNGFELLAYWLLSWRTWGALAVSRYITLGLMLSGLIVVFWYVALVLLVADTVRKDPALSQNIVGLPVLGGLLEVFYGAADAIGQWYWWCASGSARPSSRCWRSPTARSWWSRTASAPCSRSTSWPTGRTGRTSGASR